MACAGTDTQKFIDLMETMFGDLDIEDIDISELESETTKELRKEAEAAETSSKTMEGGTIPKVTRVLVTSLPVPTELGIPLESLPETENVKERSSRNPAKKITKFYYACRFCLHSSQNKASMMTHTRRCLNIKLVCAICDKEYDSAEYIEKHINDVHAGICTPKSTK